MTNSQFCLSENAFIWLHFCSLPPVRMFICFSEAPGGLSNQGASSSSFRGWDDWKLSHSHYEGWSTCVWSSQLFEVPNKSRRGLWGPLCQILSHYCLETLNSSEIIKYPQGKGGGLTSSYFYLFVDLGLVILPYPVCSTVLSDDFFPSFFLPSFFLPSLPPFFLLSFLSSILSAFIYFVSGPMKRKQTQDTGGSQLTGRDINT